MDSQNKYNELLVGVRQAYSTHPEMVAFAPFPDQLKLQALVPQHRASCDLMRSDSTLTSARYKHVTQRIRQAAPDMHWRETYKEEAEGNGFMDRWGCFAVIGADSPFVSTTLRIFVVYMPRGLIYPSHRHPAEEIYLVLGGRAVFRREGYGEQTLCEGQTVFHAGNQPHAIETKESPVLCLVAWRNHLTTPPVLVPDMASVADAGT